MDGGDTYAGALIHQKEGLGFRVDLKDAHAPHIQPVASLGLRNADEYALAGVVLQKES